MPSPVINQVSSFVQCVLSLCVSAVEREKIVQVCELIGKRSTIKTTRIKERIKIGRQRNRKKGCFFFSFRNLF